MVKKIIQKLTIIFALIFVFIPNNASALSWSYGTSNVTGYYTGSSDSNITFDFANGSRIAEFIMPANTRLTQLNFNFASGTDFNTTVKPKLSGTQYFNTSFHMTCGNGVYLNSIGTVSYRLPVITEIRLSNTSDFAVTRVFGYNSQTGEFMYPSNALEEWGSNDSYISVSGYIPNSENWDGILTFGGAILQNGSGAGKRCGIGPPTINLYDSEASQIQGSIDNQTQQMQQDKQENQQQGSQGQTDSNQSGTDVSQNTTSILNAITGFFSAFTSATPTNCNMDWGLASYGFGVINMCQNPIPQEFQVILSIISLLIVVPMILWLFSSIINAFKEFQS